jgi:hypothetical protein
LIIKLVKLGHQLEATSKKGFWFNPPEANKNRDGAVFQTGGILQYFKDLKQGTNKEFGPKNFFEIAFSDTQRESSPPFLRGTATDVAQSQIWGVPAV